MKYVERFDDISPNPNMHRPWDIKQIQNTIATVSTRESVTIRLVPYVGHEAAETFTPHQPNEFMARLPA
jgi:hypothetical protein